MEDCGCCELMRPKNADICGFRLTAFFLKVILKTFMLFSFFKELFEGQDVVSGSAVELGLVCGAGFGQGV